MAKRSRWVIALMLLVLAALSWSSGREAKVGETDERTHGPQAAALTGPRGRPEPRIDPRLALRAAIAGRVVNLQGGAIAGAQVCATAVSRWISAAGVKRPICTASGADGRYRIGELFGVEHRVVASAAGHIPAAYHRGEGVRRRNDVRLRPAMEATNIDITLEGGGVQVSGIIKDLSGGAVEGAVVTVEDAVTFSDPEGRFTAWVRPGDVVASAQAEGYASGYERGAAPGHSFTVHLTPESVLIGKVVRVDDGAPIEGARVTPDTAYGYEATFTDAAGEFRLEGLHPGQYKPHAETEGVFGQADEKVILGLGETSAPIVVRAHPIVGFDVEGAIVGAGDGAEGCSLRLNDRATGREGYGVHTPDGLLRARGVAAGDYEVSVECEGLLSEERYANVVVTDADVTGLRWAVSPGRAIRGRVVDAGGKPVPRVQVAAVAAVEPGNPRARQTDAPWQTSDEQGRFELAGLLPGDYYVSVTSWDRAVPAKPRKLGLLEGKDLEGVEIELPADGEIRGSVRDSKGRPVGKTTVALAGVDRWSVAVDDAGKFHIRNVAPGEHRLVAYGSTSQVLRAPGSGDDDVHGEKVTVRAGAVEEVQLVVEAHDGRLTGVVRDGDGAPVHDAFIEATRESDSAAKTGGAMRDGRWRGFDGTPHLTDHDGRFTLEGLAEGKYTILAHRNGGGEAIAEHVAPGDDVVLTMEATGRMSGTVSLPGGEPPESFMVALRDESTGVSRRDGFYRTAGAWSFAELPAGDYLLSVSADTGSAEFRARVIAGEDTVGVQIQLAPRVTVRGTVVDLEGNPVEGMFVMVRDRSGNSVSSGAQQKSYVTDAAGRYELAKAVTGPVMVWLFPNSSNGEYEARPVPMEIAATGPVVELPPIRVARKRVRDGEVAGDFGHSFREAEPGSDVLKYRLVVAVVRPGSPAATAGLRPGDELVSVDGQDVTGGDALLVYSLLNVPVGTVVQFGLADGRTLAITAGAKP